MGNKHPRPLRPGETPPPDAVPGQGDGPAPAASSTPDDSTHGTPAEAGPAETAGAPAGAQKACLDDFELLKTVGKGSFGKVVQVRKKDDGKIYAMKILKKEMILKRKQYEHTLSERRVLENIDHPFIVSLRFAFQSEHKLYMVFDFFNGGELYHYLSEGGRFAEERARFYAAELTSALGYLHARGIIYRDLKPENLILDHQGHIRIADFGLSKEGVEGESVTSICGTPEYLAPEILRRKPYGVGVDWWALGTLLYEMIAGLPPFYDRNRQTMYRKILEAPLTPPAWMSPAAADLCAHLLNRDPAQRYGSQGVEAIKQHAFFAGLDWGALDRKELPPPWTPAVAGAEDTSNIAKEFTSEPAGVTPSPAGMKLRDVMGSGATPPSFSDFTFTHESVIDGQVWQVSFSEEDEAALAGASDAIDAAVASSAAAGGQGGGGGVQEVPPPALPPTSHK